MAAETTFPSAIKLQGYLEKQSYYLKLFRKRWIVLRKMDDNLYCYKTKDMKDVTEIINLTEFKLITTNRADKFTLIHREGEDRNRVFRAMDKSMLNAWMTTIVKQSITQIFHTKAI